MFRRSFRSRAPATVAAALGVVSLLFGGVPSHGQQGRPTVQHSCPAAADVKAAVAGATLSYSLPPGFRLARNPRLRVTDANGKLVELLPAFISAGPSAGRAARDLHTGVYRAGAFQVRAEIDYLDPSGKHGTAVSSPTPLSVPKR